MRCELLGELTGPMPLARAGHGPSVSARAVRHERSTNAVVDRALDHQARAGRADLAGVLEDRAEDVVDRGVEVAVGEHHDRRLAAELQHQPRDVARRPRASRAWPVAHRAGEGDVVDAGVRDQRRADLRAGAGDHVAHAAGRPASLQQCRPASARSAASVRPA